MPRRYLKAQTHRDNVFEERKLQRCTGEEKRDNTQDTDAGVMSDDCLYMDRRTLLRPMLKWQESSRSRSDVRKRQRETKSVMVEQFLLTRFMT